MDKTKATTTGVRIDEHDYYPGILVELCGEFGVGTSKVQPVWALIMYIFGMSSDVTVANQSTTGVYDLAVDSDGFRRLDLDGPVVDEKAEMMRAMELATRMG